MRILRKEKVNFPKDPGGRTILKTTEDIAIWVKLGFEEQKKKYRQSIQEVPFELTIDLSNCSLSTSYSLNSDGTESRIFNLRDLADTVDGIKHLKNNNEYLFEIEENIDFSNSILYGAFFHYVVFKRRVRFYKAQIISNTSFFKCIFHETAIFDGVIFPSTTTFTSCLFKESFYIQKAKMSSFSIEFWNVIFENSFNASRLMFTSHGARISEHNDFIRFRGCTFKGESILSNIEFTISTVFIECTFSGSSTFDDSTFNKSLLLKDCHISNKMSFKGDSRDGSKRKNPFEKLTLCRIKVSGDIHFEKKNINQFDCCFSVIESGGRFRFSKSSINNFTFSENSVNGRIDIIESQIDRINLNATIVTGYLNLLNTELNKRNISNRYTAQTLKNESLKLNNVIQSVQMKQIEMRMYLDELIQLLKWNRKNESFKSYLHNIPLGRIILLSLNCFSNGFGAKWGQGVFFTMIIAFIFFSLINFFGVEEPVFVVDFKFDNFGEVWKGYLNILNVLNFREKLEGFQLNAWGETLFFTSKIFLSYGIYQTVSAFRKYGK